MKPTLVIILAIASTLFTATAALADFRYGNTWVIGRSAAERSAAGSTVRGAETNYNYVSIYNVSCTPRRDATYENGKYHHFRCVADVRRYNYWVAFDYWQIGQRPANNRWTDIDFFRCTVKTCGSKAVSTSPKVIPPATPSPATYFDTGSGHWVTSVSSGGSVIELEDGSTWLVEPFDQIDTQLWLAVDSITVLDGGDPGFPYRLVNTDEGEVAHAQYLGS